MHHTLIVKVCLCFLCLTFWKTTYAQTITIKSISLQPSDATAIEQPCFDMNGDTCALLKIKTDNLEGIEFPNFNQYIKKDYLAGIYYVYVPAISKKLDLLHKDYMPVQIDMSAYGYKKLRKGKTYLVVLDAPKKIDLKSSIIIKVEPKQSQITFDEQTYEAQQNGTFEFPVLTGNHIYEVSAQNYHSQKGSINIGKSEVKTISVHLQPITHEVLIESNVVNAHAFIDNMDYGKVGKLLIPQGEHTIRVQADGFVDAVRTVTINATTAPLSFILEKNKRTTHIHAIPITIHSSSSRIYKNNKEIKEWTDGAAIMFMPNEEYMLSNADGTKEMTITVGSEPLTVYLDLDKCVPTKDLNKSATTSAPSTSPAKSGSSKQEGDKGTIQINSKASGSSSLIHFTRVTNQDNPNHNVAGNVTRSNNSNGSTTNRSSSGSKDKVFEVVEQMPSFPGGQAALMSWLSSNIKYPVVAEENGVQGRVACTFVVERDGSITNVQVVRGVDPSLDKEAVRVLRAMPKWIPGKQKGSVVRVKYTTPVTFSLQ